MDEDEKQKLRSWAYDMGIGLSPSRIDLFSLYLSELFEWNKRINLTGLSSRKRIIKELLLDSLIPLSFLPEEGRFLDIGSGAGFPAIPIKICRPRIKAHLLEPNSKKISFLKQVIRLTKLCEIEIIRGRIERDGNRLFQDGYHIISSRALAHLPQILAWCAPYLMPGGIIVSFLGSRFENTLKECSDIIKKQRLILYKSIPYTLPGKASQRHLLIFRKGE